MDKAIYCILLLCGILLQGICSLSEENIGKSSHIHSRQRRISGGMKRPFDHAPSIVSILVHEDYHCPATLLTTDAAITSANCVKNQNSVLMKIQSQSLDGQHYHRVVRVIFLDPNYNMSQPAVNNLALIKFTPAINSMVSLNRPVTIFTGELHPFDQTYQVFNWGTPPIIGGRRITTTHLRSIFMNLISIEYCQQLFAHSIIVGRGNLCAYSENCGEYCHDRDIGAPLFVHDQLLGIMALHGHIHHVNPEVFMNLLDHGIRRWIHEHLPSLHLV